MIEPPDQPMHCLRCGYDLVGTPPGTCPECGGPFDPDEPSTWSVHPGSRWRRALRSRWAGCVLVSLVVVWAMWVTILPRPHATWDGRVDPRVWIWFERPFGIERRDGLGERLELTWWSGELTGVRLSHLSSGTPSSGAYTEAWDMRRRGDQWWLRVGPDVPASSLLMAFNSMRDDSELFGLIIDDPSDPQANAPNPPSPARRRNQKPFSATGHQEDVFSAIIRTYAFRVRSNLITPDDPDLWVFDEEAGKLERISVEKADALGVEYGVLDGMRVSRYPWP